MAVRLHIDQCDGLSSLTHASTFFLTVDVFLCPHSCPVWSRFHPVVVARSGVLHRCSNAFRSGVEVPRCRLFPTSSIPGSEAADTMMFLCRACRLCLRRHASAPLDSSTDRTRRSSPSSSTIICVQQELRCLKRRRILSISNWETDEARVDLETEAEVVALCVGSFKRKTSPLSSPAPRCFAKNGLFVEWLRHHALVNRQMMTVFFFFANSRPVLIQIEDCSI